MINGAPESSNLAHDMQFFSKSEYFDELNRRVQLAGSGSQILLMSMSFDPSEQRIAEVMTNLEQAAARGASVTFGVDAYSFLIDENQAGPLFLHTSMPAELGAPFSQKLAWLDKLNQYPNSRAIILNKPQRKYSLWIAGRSHIKAAVIDDYSLIGGANLDEPDLLDMMAGVQNQGFADELYGTLGKFIETKVAGDVTQQSDQTIAIDTNSRILIDAGVRNKSIIYDAGLRLIDAAQDWLVITCQYFPNARTAQHLLQAKERNVNVEILYSPPEKHGLVGGLGQQASVLLERTRLPANMFDNQLSAELPKLHAKLIACEQGMITGSHNFVEAGVKLGTAEIAIQIDNGDLARIAAGKIKSIIASQSRLHSESNS